MSPEQYVIDRIPILEQIEALRAKVEHMKVRAENSHYPQWLRPAEAADIKEGQVIWYKDCDEDDCSWQIVKEVHNPSNLFRAYTAESGCRYGLKYAHVRKVVGL